MLQWINAMALALAEISANLVREAKGLFAWAFALSWQRRSKLDYLSVATPQHLGTFLPQAHHRRFLAIAFDEIKLDQAHTLRSLKGDGEW